MLQAQQNKNEYLERKLLLEEKFNTQKLQLERDRLEFEQDKSKKELELKELEIKNAFEIQKLKLIQEQEVKIHELNLKYNTNTDK